MQPARPQSRFKPKFAVSDVLIGLSPKRENFVAERLPIANPCLRRYACVFMTVIYTLSTHSAADSQHTGVKEIIKNGRAVFGPGQNWGVSVR